MARSAWIGAVLALATTTGPALAEQAPSALPVSLVEVERGATSDATGLWTDEEVMEGGSNTIPPIQHASFAVDGGRATLAVLVGPWCGLSDCPYRFRLETDGGQMLRSHGSGDYGMICQSDEPFTADPIELTLTACGQVIDLKTAR